MPIRLCKIALSAASAFFLFLVVFNNVFDYGSNFAFVENVLGMSTTFEGNKGMWRAIESPVIHHLFYLSIIGWETLALVIIGFGTWKLWQARSASAAVWEKAKNCTVVGHTISLLQWYVAFLTVGAEWFLMWQSQTWNGQSAAHRMFVVMGLVMVFIVLRDRDPAEETA
jgi:predicted small integral membrane protein